MPTVVVFCARCAVPNHPSCRFCERCGLPLGTAIPDAEAGADALGPYEAPDPEDPDPSRLLRQFVERATFESSPSGHGWRMIVPLQLDRRQAVYVGLAGTDAEGRPILSLVSVCGPSNERDSRILLKLNARAVEGHFAIKVLRGEEYFVVIENVPAVTVDQIDAAGLVRRIAEVADGLEDRLSRGLDLY
ncbi:MAG: hypothetical protein U0794_18125 [Isosphaeraceae bacterium]